jgi:hypothetical protein
MEEVVEHIDLSLDTRTDPMTRTDGPGSSPAVSDELIAGIHHALNNRVGALGAIAQVLAEEMRPEHPLRTALVREVDRLQQTVRSLALLPEGQNIAEPVLLSECFRGLMEIYGYHHAARDIPCHVESAADLLPVWAPPARLMHVLLALLITAAEAAQRHGGAVRLSCTGDTEQVAIAVEWIGGSGAEALSGVEQAGGADRLETALRARVAGMGGELRVERGTESPLRFEIRIPTLPAVRRHRSTRPDG